MAGKCVLGIDPGLSGGLALLGPDGVVTEPMPVIGNMLDKTGLLKWLESHADDISMAYLELSSSRPGQSSQSTFTFGRGFGTLEMALVAARIPYETVSPQAWTKVMHARLSKEMKPKDKSRIVVEQLYPHVNLKASERCKVAHEGMMDALLIASYGQKIRPPA